MQIGWLPRDLWTHEETLYFEAKGIKPVCWFKNGDVIRVSDVLARNPKIEITHHCVNCGVEIKRFDALPTSKDWEGMFDGGIVDVVAAGYGSKLDGDKYVIAICDNCIKSRNLKYVGNYMFPSMTRN